VTKPIPHLYAVVLAGGSGTRFWPLSRELYPKQLLKVLSNQTLIQQTVLRVRPIVPAERTLVVTGAGHVDGIRIQLDGAAGVPKENILIEPVARNTAAAIGWAAETLRRLDPDGVMLVMPADHVIPDEPKFLRAVALAVQVAQTGKLVTFGIKPTRPETGYGYIKAAGRHPLLSQGGLKALAWPNSWRSQTCPPRSATCAPAGSIGTAASSSGGPTRFSRKWPPRFPSWRAG